MQDENNTMPGAMPAAGEETKPEGEMGAEGAAPAAPEAPAAA